MDYSGVSGWEQELPQRWQCLKQYWPSLGQGHYDQDTGNAEGDYLSERIDQTAVTTDAQGTFADAPEESAAKVLETAGTLKDLDGKVEGFIYDVPWFH